MKKFSPLLLATVLAITALSGLAQNKTEDWVLLMDSGRPTSGLKSTATNSFDIYRTTVKPQLALFCYFELPCSSFSPAMIKRYGLLKGYFLTIDRLVRCTKISALETYSIRLSPQGKIKESPEDFHFH